MNNQATIEKMSQMKLHGMIRAFKSTMETGAGKKFTADELLGHMIDAEWDDRYNRKITRLIKAAGFRYQASMEQIDYSVNRNLDKNLLLRLSDCTWIQKKQDIIVTGATGTGKSYIASALGHQGCMHEHKVLYFNCKKLFSKLKQSKADGTDIKELKKIQKQEVLILDDFGLPPFDNDSRLALLEIIEDRHGIKSTVIATQFPIKNWFDIIGEPTIADAICDRIIHNAHRIELKGESMRKKQRKKLT